MTADGSGALILPPDPSESPTAALKASQDNLLDALTLDLDAQDDPEVLLDLLSSMRSCRKAWHAAEQMVEDRLGQVAGVGQHEPAPGRAFKVRKGSTSITWSDDDLKRLCLHVGRDRMVDKETGEVRESEGESVARAIWTALGSSLPWTVSGLKELGIDPYEHRQSREGRRSVEIIG